jgi:nicotinate phosphoribosyltransferase
LIAAGLEQVLEYLEGLHLTEHELRFLQGDPQFRPEFLAFLRDLRFTGDVDALPEGTILFADEPLLRVTAPIAEAQLVESRIINLLHFQTTIASKAARSVLVAGGRSLIDFGMRRAHGAEAALLAARSAYLAGFSGTSNVLAGQRYGIPLSGTMAHSYVQAHADELSAFAEFARANPRNVTLLIDTYDTELAATQIVPLAARLAEQGIAIQAVRLDSGDLGELAQRVRTIFDRGGLQHVRIFASGNLDEYQLRDLVTGGAPIDGFGVGTRMDVAADAPYLDCAYKLQEYAGVARRKRSTGKATWPGRKQVFRHCDGAAMRYDTLGLETESPGGEPLLVPVLRAGRRVRASESLDAIRQRVATGLAQLPARLRELEHQQPYRVEVSQQIRELAASIDALQPALKRS